MRPALTCDDLPALAATFAARSGLRHLAVAALTYLALSAGLVLAVMPQWWAALGSLLIGMALFATTILLHEQAHGLVFARRRARWERVLAVVYACPAGLSATQFTRWHLDHHAWLGEHGRDPKRTHLSPKRNRRLIKLSYFCALLFPRYFHAARAAAAGYSQTLRRRIVAERVLVLLVHAAWVTGLAWAGAWWSVCWGYLVPLFVVFPVLFAINRLGQHYLIDPRHPIKMATRVDGNLVWHLAFLWSNFHLEHHLYPQVPFYRLPALNRALRPCYHAINWPSLSYTALLWHWLVRNAEPHTWWLAEPQEATQQAP
ncbi:MAG: fatty acid desaturase [Planctomycetota bacterium]|jgi:fatty acid desaturase|nr:fatty acid desaturase [Planctomycetota bacterium]